MQLHGQNLIGFSSVPGSSRFSAVNPATGATLPPDYFDATPEQIGRAMQLAQSAFLPFAGKTPEQRAAFLDAIAAGIESLGDVLIERANAESGLPVARLTMERARTIGQARMFANLAREGSWVEARIDLADPERKPLPKPDVRRMLLPIGPVVVFGASNFPLAISVAGCDALSAFAAGCPVVVKAHPSQPGTCEMIGRVIVEAAKSTGMPEGVFSMLHGARNEVGLALVNHPATQAVAFTGSLKGGRALFDAAAARPNPVPVYAEMGSTNPVFILPGALAANSASIAERFVQSMTLGVGQFCTQPGIVVGLKGEPLEKFTAATAELAAKVSPATMLNAGICSAYNSGVSAVEKLPGVSVASKAQGASSNQTTGAAVVFVTDVSTFLRSPTLSHELFGPSSVIVNCDSVESMYDMARRLEGQLTATIHGTPADLKQHAELVRILQAKAGRIVFNGFPTGVEICQSMHHGGPYPATTHAYFNSIGPTAILRFVRPVCFQDFPDESLPAELRRKNERGIWRYVNGQYSKSEA